MPKREMRKRGQSAFELLLLTTGAVLFVILAVTVVRTAINTNSQSANNTAGGYQNYLLGQSDRNIASAAIKASCIAYWPFNEGTGTSTTDWTGHGYTGTLTNGPTWTTGISGNAILFDGSNDYVNTANITFKNNFTLVAWVQQTGASTGTNRMILGKFLDYTFMVDGPVENTTGIDMDIGSGWATSSSRTAALTNNVWYQIAMVKDSVTGVSLYVNGGKTPTASMTQNLVMNSNNLQIGAWNGGSEAFKGVIDEVAVYNRSLTTAEIVGLYNTKESGCA